MTAYDDLIERARAGERILIDGGTGSECIRRGAPELSLGWSGGAVLTHPEIVRAVHDDYLALGADLIVSNTFATGRNVLADSGVVEHFEAANRRAVEIAVEARDGAGSAAAHVVVGAGISNWSFAEERLDLDRLHADTVTQATIMRTAGAEFFSLEMMVDLDRFATTLDAVSGLDLPIWVGCSLGPEEGCEVHELGEPIPLRDEGLLRDAVALSASNDRVDSISIMHTDVRLVDAGLAVVAAGWSGPIGAYAHAVDVVDGEMIFVDAITPADYAAHVPGWLDAGATMVGGCCGIGPAHLAEVATALGR